MPEDNTWFSTAYLPQPGSAKWPLRPADRADDARQHARARRAVEVSRLGSPKQMKLRHLRSPEGTRVETVLVVIFFALFSAMVAFIIRPRNRRRSRRRIALNAATDQPGPPFIERRRASRMERLKDFFSRHWPSAS
jgi:hypothetical protein